MGYTQVVGEQYHTFVILTDTETGQQFATRAGPTTNSFSGSASDAGSGGGYGFGPIHAQTGPYDSSFIDQPNVVATQSIGTIPTDYSQAVANAQNFANVTNANGIPYWVLGPNSNSYASTFTESLTGTRPTLEHSAPGSDMGTPSSDLNYSPTPLVTSSSGNTQCGQ